MIYSICIQNLAILASAIPVLYSLVVIEAVLRKLKHVLWSLFQDVLDALQSVLSCPNCNICHKILNGACILHLCVCFMPILQFQHCCLMCRNILPTGAALMSTLDEMCVLSMRMFFNSLTYQANKLLEKVNTLLCYSSCFRLKC